MSSDEWGKICQEMKIYSPWHTWHMLDYYSRSCNAVNLSFILQNENGHNIALCPFMVSEEIHAEFGLVNTASVNGQPIPSPLLSGCSTESQRRKNLKQLESAIAELSKNHKIVCSRFVFRAYTYCTSDSILFRTNGLFDLLEIGYLPVIYQSVTIDLRKSVAQLEAELSHYHRKEIRRARREDQKVLTIDLRSSKEEIKFYFQHYQSAHYKAAGRRTRPQDSFDLMEQMLSDGLASLFISELDGEFVSFLYCGEKNGIAFGWSQVNIADFKVTSPRHLLEWTAIEHYKKNRDFFLYDVGPKYFAGQFGLSFTDKQANIGFFKERFGGDLCPEVHYKKYYDESFRCFELKKDFSNQLNLVCAT